VICRQIAHVIVLSQVRLAEGDKWQDVEYLKHTSLKTYMPYMMGGGYVLSADLAHVILGINQQVRRPPSCSRVAATVSIHDRMLCRCICWVWTALDVHSSSACR
jgi:hypothetical protein